MLYALHRHKLRTPCALIAALPHAAPVLGEQVVVQKVTVIMGRVMTSVILNALTVMMQHVSVGNVQEDYHANLHTVQILRSFVGALLFVTAHCLVRIYTVFSATERNLIRRSFTFAVPQ